MQRKLLGIAVAAALAPAAAFAQPAGTGVQIYGLIDFSANHFSYDDATAPVPGGGEVSKGEFYSSGSRLGIRGREALGAGLNGWFQLEAGIAPFRPDPNSTSAGAGFFGGRDSAVGLEGGWGTLMGGIWGSPYKVASLATWSLGTYGIVSHYGMIMNNGDTTGTEASPNCANGQGGAPTFTHPGATATICGALMAEGSTTSFGRRLSNTVQYWTPNIGGFQARLATQLSGLKSPDGAATPTDPALYALSVQWTGGPFTIGAAYELHEEFRASGVAGAPRPKDSAYMIGAKWAGGPFSISAGFEQLEYENSSALAAAADNFKRQNFVVNGAFRLANGEIFAGYSWTPGNDDCGAGLVTAAALLGSDCETATEASFLSVGYAHSLSKRTKAYIQYGLIDNGLAQSVNIIAAPGGNAAGGTGGIFPGTDIQMIGVGVQHSF